MKNVVFIKIFFIILLLYFVPLHPASAQEYRRVNVDGIWYALYTDNTAALAFQYVPEKYNYRFGINDTTFFSVPETIEFEGKIYPVDKIDGGAFNVSHIDTLIIPNSIRYIRGDAFDNNSHIGKLYLCSMEDYFHIQFIDGNSMLSCAGQIYMGGEPLSKDLIIPEGTAEIPAYAFKGLAPDREYSGRPEYVRKIESVTFPSTLKKIGKGCFNDCYNLKVYICDLAAYCAMEGGSIYSSELYVNGQPLKDELIIPTGVEVINDYAFMYVDNITSVKFPNSLKYIGDLAFMNANKITSVELPNSVKHIGIKVFADSLKNVNIPENLEYLGDGKFGEVEVKKITLPSTLKYVGNWAFYSWPILEEVEVYGRMGRQPFPKTIKKAKINSDFDYNSQPFGDSSNRYDSLKVVILGKDVGVLSSDCFKYCNNLMKVVSYNTYPNHISEDAFSSNTYSNGVLYVPKSAKEYYTRLDGWRRFRNIQYIEDEEASCYLTLQDAVEGRMKIKVQKGSSYSLQIEPEEGWHVLSVSFNGEDITGNLTGQNELETPVLADDATIVVVYEQQNPENVSAQATVDLKVKIVVGGMLIENAPYGMTCQIYNINGVLERQMVANSRTIFVALPPQKTFIVKAGERIFKLQTGI